MSAQPKAIRPVGATDHLMEAPMPAPLTATEKSAFRGLQAQAREYERAVNDQERAIISEIEARLGLDAGSIGATHTVNPQTWAVMAIPQPDAQIAAVAQQHAEAVWQRDGEATAPEAEQRSDR